MNEKIQKLLLFLTSCGFIGYLPFAPGTYASVLGCVLVYLFPFHSIFINLFFVCCFIIFSIICINMLKFDGRDPGYIVIDEMAGMFVTMAGHKATILNILIGFVLFRVFDIIKPYPIKKIEDLGKGYGIVADDILAGIFANLVLVVWGKFAWC